MRNLCSTFSHLSKLPSGTAAGRIITATCVDVETDRSWVAVEAGNGGSDESKEVEIWMRSDTLSEEIKPTARLTSFAPSPAGKSGPGTLSLKYFPEEQHVCLVLRSGEIALANTAGSRFGQETDDVLEMEIVGEVEFGLLAAAWSPDEEQLVLVTGEDQVIVMSREFDVLYEAPLRTESFGEDEQINVGWGSKKTQFHGSLGKAAAAAATQQPTILPAAHSSDDGQPRITWRGDAQYFAISSLDRYATSPDKPPRRQVRVYTRNPCALSTTSEPIYGLGQALAWRPAGNLIAGIKRFGYEGGGDAEEGSAKAEVVFLERNGLQHGSFELREDQKEIGGRGSLSSTGRGKKTEFSIRDMAWNSDSTVLAVWIERESGDVVQLWTMNNYHYYLKQELFPHGSSRFHAISWHPEHALTLYLAAADTLKKRSFAWETVSSRLEIPKDTGSVAVIDGARILMTPFRTQNVPPPMSSYVLDLPSTPVHIAFSPVKDTLVVLFAEGFCQIWNLRSATKKLKGVRGGTKAADPVLVGTVKLFDPEDIIEARQICIDADARVVALGSKSTNGDCLIDNTGNVLTGMGVESIGRITLNGDGKIIAVNRNGSLLSTTETKSLNNDLPSFCFDLKASLTHLLIFAMTPGGRLYACSEEAQQLVASDCTSFTLSTTFLIYTTSAHDSKYASLDTLRSWVSGEIDDPTKTWETRRVERGSQIVTVVPSAMSLVLQMPRGNLETINPRPLVLEVLKRDILAGRYRAAFLACRKHRIDLNILYDLDPEAFMGRLSSFIDQVPEVDYLNLFISGLKQDLATMPHHNLGSGKSCHPNTNKINSICDAIREELVQRGLVRYVDTILTSYVCKLPPDYEAALRVLLELREEQPKVVEDAIKYVIFLTDVNKLFDVALGMYDFQLVLMVAQYSQKDPGEYLPFLRELKSYEKFYQRFKIDDHLERRSSALSNLHQCGSSRFAEATMYIVRYELFEDALRIYRDEVDNLQEIRGYYGEHLYNQHRYSEAAMAFVLASQLDRAMAAYERSHQWRELFALAVSQKIGVSEMEDMCTRVAEYLTSSGKYLEAALVFLDYRQSDGQSGLEDAVHTLCRGSEFAEAYRLTSLHGRPDLIETFIYTGLEDAQETLMDVFNEMEGQLDKELSRIQELVGPGGKMDTDPDAFFMIEAEPALDNVDVATDVTGTTASMFTRYTVARSSTTAFTSKSGQSSASKKRMKRQMMGRKGTVGEWEYLVSSLGRLAARVDEKTGEVTPLLPFLALSSNQPDHGDLAFDLREKVSAFRTKMQASIDKAWEEKEMVQVARKKATLGDLGGADGNIGAELEDAVRKWREKEGLGGDEVIAPAGEPEAKLQTKPLLSEWKGGNIIM